LEIIFTSPGIPHGAELTILSNWEETSCELILRLKFSSFCQEKWYFAVYCRIHRATETKACYV